MKAILTANELISLGLWDKFCDLRGYDRYCVSEGQRDSDEEIVLSLDEMEKLGVRVTVSYVGGVE